MNVTITKTAAKPAFRMIVYGPSGIGKTLLGSCFKNPILLRIEDGIPKGLEVPTFADIAKNYDDVLQACQAVATAKSFNTLVVDSVDWLDSFYTKNLCAKAKCDSLAEIGGGFGKGYAALLSLWSKTLELFERLVQGGISVLLLAHSDVKKIDPPDRVAFSRYDLKLPTNVSNLLKEWADAIGFLHRSAKTGNKPDRCISFESDNLSFEGKNRLGFSDFIKIGEDPKFNSFIKELYK